MFRVDEALVLDLHRSRETTQILNLNFIQSEISYLISLCYISLPVNWKYLLKSYIYSSILAWEVPQTKKHDELHSMGSKMDTTEHVHTHTHTHIFIQYRSTLYCILYSQSVSSAAQSCLTLCDPMDCSTPGLPVHHQLLEFTQTHVH